MGAEQYEPGSSSTAYAAGAPSTYGTLPSASTAPPSQRNSRKRKTEIIDLTEDGDEDTNPIIDLTAEASPPKKRRATPKGKEKAVSKPATLNTSTESTPKKNNAKKQQQQEQPKKTKPEEKREKRYRNHPPTSYLQIRERALTQRMFVLDRQRHTPKPNPDTNSPPAPTETVTIAGTTGNIYTVKIKHLPSCNCPHALDGNQCKHLIYVLSRVLRCPSNLEYQLAFLSSELYEIFSKAPPIPGVKAFEQSKDDNHHPPGNRKPLEDDCPICCMEFRPAREEIVYCKTSCGNNIHKTCFEQWAATKPRGGVTCPFCRSAWQEDEVNKGTDDMKNLAKNGPRNEDGYVNVAGRLGISGRRDYSSYHSYWVRRAMRDGDLAYDPNYNVYD